MKMTRKMKIVISGSFSKHYSEIKKLIIEFEKEEVLVLSPKISKIVNPGEKFPILLSDTVQNPKEIEKQHLDAIYHSDALYICNPDGYVGSSSSMELGWALAFNKPIYSQVKINDFSLEMFVQGTGNPKDIKRKLIEHNDGLIENIGKYPTLDQLQKYIEHVVLKRGFSKETPRDILLLMVEELGELAKTIRKEIGLKTDKNKNNRYPRVSEELADILIYLLDLSNTCGIKLFDSFYKKELLNSKRIWD